VIFPPELQPSSPYTHTRKSSHAFAPLPGDQRNTGNDTQQHHP